MRGASSRGSCVIIRLVNLARGIKLYLLIKSLGIASMSTLNGVGILNYVRFGWSCAVLQFRCPVNIYYN